MSQQYITFITRVKKKLGIDLSLYKEAQMKRRILSLSNKRGFNDLASYFEALNKDNELLLEFTDRLTINVSEFYRNPQRWDILHKKVLTSLFKYKQKINIWSAACSTGEEPYTLGIMIKEHYKDKEVNILATDLDDKILARAREGIYQKQALKEVPDFLVKKYFKIQNELYYVDPSIKKMITFKRHNLLADSYPQNIDLIVCRNVLIYFTDDTKVEIYRNFSKSLGINGVLFVGSTEQIFAPDQYNLEFFDTFFYKRK